MRSIVVISGGVSEPSTTTAIAQQLATAVRSAVGARGEQATITTIELRGLAIDLAKALISRTLSPELTSAYEAVANADGVIAVSPTFPPATPACSRCSSM